MVHGDIRHLESIEHKSKLEASVHGDIRHLEIEIYCFMFSY